MKILIKLQFLNKSTKKAAISCVMLNPVDTVGRFFSGSYREPSGKCLFNFKWNDPLASCWYMGHSPKYCQITVTV